MLHRGEASSLASSKGSTLRGVDLNLLTVFDAVMQEQNITRAASHLGMSQPAVSNAVSRLKLMFDDELFMRHGRGILPTQRARQLSGPVRQVLQTISNELPGTQFVPETSDRLFRLAFSAPCDVRFAARILAGIARLAPGVELQMDADTDRQPGERLRFQETDFVIGYHRYDQSGFVSRELFRDELVVVAAKDHPRLGSVISEQAMLSEKHARLTGAQSEDSFSDQAYRNMEVNVAYRGRSLSNLIYVVAQSDLITIAPRWLVESVPHSDQVSVLNYPRSNASLPGYLSWHESNSKDKGHQWMGRKLVNICSEVVS